MSHPEMADLKEESVRRFCLLGSDGSGYILRTEGLQDVGDKDPRSEDH
jgi:hypothetical protein